MTLYNNCIVYAFKNLFARKITSLSTGINLGKYVQTTQKNWDNYNLNNVTDFDNKYKDDENNKNKNIDKRSPNNLNKLYGIYNYDYN